MAAQTNRVQGTAITGTRHEPIRSVERNPVRAKMVLRAEEYACSSAAAHCGLADDLLLSQRLDWKKRRQHIAN
jgi:hypothetical protein